MSKETLRNRAGRIFNILYEFDNPSESLIFLAIVSAAWITTKYRGSLDNFKIAADSYIITLESMLREAARLAFSHEREETFINQSSTPHSREQP